MTRWFANSDAITTDADWAPWVRYTRTPPVYSAASTDEIAAYTPHEQLLNTSVHESAHAVLYMARGYRIRGISLDPPAEVRNYGRAAVTLDDAEGPWLDFALAAAAGERAETRWLHETNRWTQARAWVAERHAWLDRQYVDKVIRTCHGRALTFNGDRDDQFDYAWLMDRADEALEPVWGQILTLAEHIAAHRHATGKDAARIAGFAR